MESREPGLRLTAHVQPFLSPVIDISKIIDFHSEADRFSLRTKDSFTLKKKYARTNVSSNISIVFFHRITDQWNQLPLDTRVSDNVNIFKSRVRKFFSHF